MKKEERSIQRICHISNDQTIVFAAMELARYLKKMINASLVVVKAGNMKDDERTIWVGSYYDLGISSGQSTVNDKYDDDMTVNITSGMGYISGINSRSVLLAVYSFLEKTGCAWPRPGASGEYVPEISDFTDISVSFEEKPVYRHRGVCLEGCVSYEDAIDFVDWLPKAGMNSFFIQYFEGYIFFKRWYANQEIKGEHEIEFPIERAQEFTDNIISEVRKRGLLFHYVGHGWTCMPLGIEAKDWDREIDPDLGNNRQYVAMIEGRRALYKNIPRRTHLCYSQKKVQQMLAETVASYAEKNTYVDYLHFWLADGSNHFCECDVCRDILPSDQFVMVLNEIDSLLTKKNIDTRIAFLIYLDTLWPPAKERIKNPDRFVMMFAPLRRSIFKKWDLDERLEDMHGFVLNKNTFKDNGHLEFLYNWKKVFDGDSFMFDYRFMWDHFNDPGYMQISQGIADDIRLFDQVGLNGIISCQTLRVFLPTSLPMLTMSRFLNDPESSFDELSKEYFKKAFGDDGLMCMDYMKNLTNCIPPVDIGEYVWLLVEKRLPKKGPLAVSGYKRIADIIAQFIPVIERNIKSQQDECLKKSWSILKHHAWIWSELSKILVLYAEGNSKEALAMWEVFEKDLYKLEDDLHQVLDIYWFRKVFEGKLTGERESV